MARLSPVLNQMTRGKRRWVAILVVLAAVAGLALLPAALGGGSGRAAARYEVTFPVLSGLLDMGEGSLAYDQRISLLLVIENTNVTRIECTLEWSDQGATPLQDPYVNLYIDYESDPQLWNADEFSAPGGSLWVDVPNEAPPNATVPAKDEAEAIALASPGANETPAGLGNWSVDVSAQAPSVARPYFGGSIQWHVTCEVFSFEGRATLLPRT